MNASSRIFAAFMIIISCIAILPVVLAVVDINILETSASASGNVGSTVSSSFTVENTGDESATVDFTEGTLTNGAHILTINSISSVVVSAASQNVVSFSVPIPSKQKAGTYTGTITAQSGTDSDTISISVVVNPTYSVSTISSLYLGNIGLDNTYSSTVVVNNTGNADLNSVQLAFSGTLDFSVSPSSTSIPYNTSKSFTLQFTTPETASVGNKSFGTVKMTSTEKNQDLFSVSANLRGGLTIEDVDVFLTTYDRQSESRGSKRRSDIGVTDGQTLSFEEYNAGPGSELKFSIELRNLFSDSDDIDIKDVSVTATIENIDDGEDLEEETDSVDIATGQIKDVEVIFTLPLAVDEGTYAILLEAEGEDDDGNTVTDTLELDLVVDKESRDILLGETSISPATIRCGGQVTIATSMYNVGAREENNLRLEIKNSELGIAYKQDGVSLESDPFDADSLFETSQKFQIPENARAKSYPIKVEAYLVGAARAWDEKTLNLVVSQCSADTEPQETADEEKEETSDSAADNDTKPTQAAPPTPKVNDSGKIPVLQPQSSASGKTSTSTIWVVVIANAILFAGLLGTAFWYMSKK